MKFPWHKYVEIPAPRKNTLQIFITSKCNLNCEGCFVKPIMKENIQDISIPEYFQAINDFQKKEGKQINLLGGEPFLHPQLKKILEINAKADIKTTIYTNGYFIDKINENDLFGAKLRVSLYCKNGKVKSAESLPKTKVPLDICFMISKKTSLEELLESADQIEKNYNCKTFFISSIRELDNPKKEFFDDTALTMNLIDYKKLCIGFLDNYRGKMDIHISKRGVFESTKFPAGNKCKFANYFPGGKIIQCPYDIINKKFQKDYEFEERFCQHNNSCLMSKVVYRKKIIS